MPEADAPGSARSGPTVKGPVCAQAKPAANQGITQSNFAFPYTRFMGGNLMSISPSRRSFLRFSVAVASTGATATRVLGANDRPAYGVIGAGGRGRAVSQAFQKLGAQCVALCEVYEPNLELARKQSPRDVRSYVDHKELLAQPSLYFVLVATHCAQSF